MEWIVAVFVIGGALLEGVAADRDARALRSACEIEAETGPTQAERDRFVAECMGWFQ